MDGRNYVNCDSYVRLLREKVKRENKVTKMQNRFIAEQQQQQRQLRPLCPKKPKKLSEKWLKQDCQQPEAKSGPAIKSAADKDLLREIDDSLDGRAKGFLLKQGN
jgi:predicted acetyltransferase